MLYSARKGGKPLYIVYVCSFFSFFPVWCGSGMRGGVPLVLSAFASSGNPLKPPRRGGKGGALIGASATHRSTRPQQERPKTQKGKRKKEKAKTKRARADALGASGEQTPPHIVAGRDFFFKKACCPRPWRGLCAGKSRGKDRAEHSGATRASFFEGRGRGVRIGICPRISTACYVPVSPL